MSSIVIAGDTSGSVTVSAPAVSGTSVLTLPVATDTLIGKATTDTLTNKTLTTPTISSLSSASATALTLQSAGTTAITIDTSQNVGIGTTSPTVKLQVNGGVKTGNGVDIGLADANNTILNIGTGATGNKFALTDYIGDTTYTDFGLRVGRANDGANGTSQIQHRGTGALSIGAIDAGVVIFYTNNTERMRIDSSGNVGINTTTQLGNTLQKMSLKYDGSVEWGISFQNAWSGNTGSALNFCNYSGTQVGTIQPGASTTSYVTSSDYRLKEDIAPMTGALDKVALLKPVTYKWKIDGSDSQGFIAHELAEVAPDCVSGEKDAVDAEGNPKYQGIDTSFLVATLTAAIQELKAIIDTQAERIKALEDNK